MTAGTRFGSKIPFLAELSKPGMFKKMGGFAKAHPPETFMRGSRDGGRGRGGARAGRGGAATAIRADNAGMEESGRHSTLLSNMKDIFTRTSILVLDELTSPLLPSLKASQCSMPNIPFDFWQTWEVAEICREAWFNDLEIKLDHLMAQHGID